MRRDIPGGWYVDRIPTGEWVVLIRGSHLEHNGSRVELPIATLKDGSRAPQNLLFVRLSPDGQKFAGVGNQDDLCWEWDAGWTSHGIAFGPNAVIYDNAGQLQIVHPPVAHGWRYVADDGRLVTCNDTIHDSTLRIWEYTETDGVVIGQGGDGPHGDDPAIVLIGGKRRLLSAGRCRFIRVRRGLDPHGVETFALAWVQEDQGAACIDRLTRVELLNLPEIAADTPPVKPKPIPLEQVEPLVGKWLVSYYEQNGNVPDGKLPPGNAMVAVRNQNNDHGPQPRPMIITPESEGKVTGTIIGYRIGSEAQFEGEVVTIEVMEARARAVAAKGYRPWFYWDEPTIPRPSVLPAGSVIELYGFCGKHESIPEWERDRRQRLREAAAWPGKYLLAISAQTHDTNDSLVPEPSVMIPPMQRVCVWARAEFGDRFLGIDIFCNSGRDFPPEHEHFGRGGLTANPQLVPHWTRLFSGVTGLPDVLGGGGEMDPTIEILDYDKKVSRRDPKGLLVRFDVSGERIDRIALSMEGDGEPPVTLTFPDGPDGRYLRAMAFKPVRTGDWFVLVKAWDLTGKMAMARSATKVKVTEDPVDPVDPIDPDKLVAPSQIEAVRKAMRDHPEIDTMNEDERGKIIDYACVDANAPGADKPWGRKARNQDGSNKNTDGMCFLRSDGKHEIYDAISGGDGSATWDGFGPFKPGENGWWAPHEPV